MRTMFPMLVAAVTLVAGSQAALADCGPNRVAASCNAQMSREYSYCCMPTGHVDCGHGKTCRPGQRCLYSGGRPSGCENAMDRIDRNARRRMLDEADEYAAEERQARERAAAQELLRRGVQGLQQQQQPRAYQPIQPPRYQPSGPLVRPGPNSCPPNYLGCGRR
jgi:hypothetical protein